MFTLVIMKFLKFVAILVVIFCTWRCNLSNNDSRFSFRQILQASDICLLEDKIQKESMHLLLISYGSFALEHKSGEGLFCGWFQIFVICTRNSNARFWSAWMRGLRQYWTKSSITPISKEESVWRNKRPRNRTVSLAADRLLCWSAIISGPQQLGRIFCWSITKIPSNDILEGWGWSAGRTVTRMGPVLTRQLLAQVGEESAPMEDGEGREDKSVQEHRPEIYPPNCLSHNSPAKRWPYRFSSRGTPGSSILDNDLSHLCRGRRIQMSGHSDFGIFNNLWTSSIFTWV